MAGCIGGVQIAVRVIIEREAADRLLARLAAIRARCRDYPWLGLDEDLEALEGAVLGCLREEVNRDG